MVDWRFLVALTVAIPVILFPVAIAYYFNLARVADFLKAYQSRRSARRSVAAK